MAGLLIFIEADGDQVAESSLMALAFARGVASTRGATVHAFVHGAKWPDVDVLHVLSQYGADTILVAAPAKGADTPPPSLDVALQAACLRTLPIGVLFGWGRAGAALAPQVAKLLQAQVFDRDSAEGMPDAPNFVLRLRRGPVPEPVSSDEAEVIPLQFE